MDATVNDGSCTYDVLGCTDPTANNYNADATVDDGSCTYDVFGCTDPTANNYNADATIDDGSCTYDTNVIEVATSVNIEAYPNPTSGDVTLQLSTEKATDVSVNIYNALGVKVSSENLGLIEGTYTYNAATAGFAAGMYIVEITDGKNSQTQKLTVR
jgi:hypothetical protein